jgi:hypothetical protein
MANTISPNMGLIVPGVGTEPGPTWATDLNADLGILDEHNHTLGQGVPIPVAGLNINANLPMNDNSLVEVATINFTPFVASLPGTPPNLGAIYVAGNELYYNDEAGNVIQITKTGSVNAGAGSITGLPSGTASATYQAGSQTFVWQSATSTPANMDGGSFIFRNILPNSNGVTVEAPASLAFNYDIVLPLPPLVSTSFVTMDTSGNMGTTSTISGTEIAPATITGSNIAPDTVTLANQVAPNIVQSPGNSGLFSSTSTVEAFVTNMSVTITTSGFPVYLTFEPLQPNSGYISCYYSVFNIYRNGVIISEYVLFNALTSQSNFVSYPPQVLNFVDYSIVGTPGTYTYQLSVYNNIPFVTGVAPYAVAYVNMFAREM